EHARRQNARARKGVADGSAGTGRMDDREDRSDRQPQGGAGTVRRRRFRRLHRQYQAHVKPMKKSLVALTLVLAAAGVFRLKAEATGTGLRAGLRAESRGFRLQAEESASDPGNGDWPMWGGTPDRNMVSGMKGLPTEWDVKTKKNVKWVAELGSQSYGNPVVAGGMVFVGTNNEGIRDPKQGGDRGVLMA